MLLLWVFMLVLICSMYVSKCGKGRRELAVDSNKWDKLILVLDQIEKNYVDSIDYNGVIEKVLPHLMENLDPHSVYLPPVELEAADESLEGNFSGIGIQFNVPADTAIVISVIAGGPSEKAGLLSGDRIIKVDGKNVAGVKLNQDSLVKMLKGPKGSKVAVEVKRDNLKELIPFEITRDKIPVKSVDVALALEDGIGYVKLSKFSKTSYKEFMAAMIPLMEQGIRSLVFDLRDNTGGYLDQALLLSREFLNRGELVVYMEGLHRERQDFHADGLGMFKDIELYVLINENSASSSEIFAGAIQDNDRGTIVGRRSYGKGLVQEPINFTDGSGIRLTVARFYTPSGRCIQKPYDKDYAYDIYERYAHGEMTSADSMKVDTSAVYYTVKGRRVYGGGGIIPDVFVPMDTTRATKFYINCNKKATAVRFASEMFDKYKSTLSGISDFTSLEKYLNDIDLERQFLDYAARVDGFRPAAGEWEQSRSYMMPQINGLVGRFSKVGEEAFYRFYLPIDDTIQQALKHNGDIL